MCCKVVCIVLVLYVSNPYMVVVRWRTDPKKFVINQKKDEE